MYKSPSTDVWHTNDFCFFEDNLKRGILPSIPTSPHSKADQLENTKEGILREKKGLFIELLKKDFSRIVELFLRKIRWGWKNIVDLNCKQQIPHQVIWMSSVSLSLSLCLQKFLNYIFCMFCKKKF